MFRILHDLPPAADSTELAPGEVVIYLRRPTGDAEALARDALLLDDAEKARAARFHFEEDRTTYVGAHALLRRALERHGAGQAAGIRFRAGARGRPELDSRGSPLSFSLSHTRRLTACAVTREADVGVDVEERRQRAYSELAAASLTGDELEAWRALPEHEREARFVLIWTLKEAYVKALGVGLSLPFRSFGVRVSPDGSAVLLPAPGQSAAGFRLAWEEVGDHFLSVAVRRREGVS